MNFFVEGALRDPASPNKPSTHADRRRLHDRHHPRHRCPLGPCRRHRRLRSLLCVLIEPHDLRLRRAASPAAMSRAAQAQGLPVGRLIVICCAIAGACAGLAGYLRGRGDPGQRQCARSPPAMASPASSSPSSRGTTRSPSSRSRSCSAASSAAGGLIQRRMGLPDATVLVLQGLIFVVLLISETLYGRFRSSRPRHGGAHMMDEHSLTVLVAMLGGAHPRLDAVHVRRARRMPDREIRPHQSRARGHAGARRDVGLRHLLP